MAGGSGVLDRAEVVAGCQILCGGDAASKLRLAFQCYDSDGDGHLSKPEVAALLRGAVTKAVRVLHASVDFAVEEAAAFGAELTSGDLEAHGVEVDEDPEGKVTVTLDTDAGEVSLRVPRDAVLGDAGAGRAATALSADEFLGAIVDDAFAAHDADGNATLEWDEFVAYSRQCAFLTAWFGNLGGAVGGGPVTWRDAHLA